jgi:hypothetical protein
LAASVKVAASCGWSTPLRRLLFLRRERLAGELPGKRIHSVALMGERLMLRLAQGVEPVRHIHAGRKLRGVLAAVGE